MNSMAEDHIQELFALYALGGLSEAERAQVEAFVAAHPEARMQLDELMEAASALAYAVAPVQPSGAVKRALMGRVHADARARFAPPRQAPLAPRARPSVAGWLLGAVAVVSLFLAVALGSRGLSQRREIIGLRAELAVLRAEIASLRGEVTAQQLALVQLTSPQAQAYPISGTEHQPDAHGQLIANTETGSAVLVVGGLERLSPGQIYEFWLINDAGAVPAGLFEVDAQGGAILQVTESFVPGAFTAIGVSIEPAGGSQQPTGDIVMLGNIN